MFLVLHHVLCKLGISPSRLKAFTLDLVNGPDLKQAREFLNHLGMGLYLEPIEAGAASIDISETVRILEDC